MADMAKCAEPTRDCIWTAERVLEFGRLVEKVDGMDRKVDEVREGLATVHKRLDVAAASRGRDDGPSSGAGERSPDRRLPVGALPGAGAGAIISAVVIGILEWVRHVFWR